MPGFLAAWCLGFLAVLVSPLVEGHRSDGKLHRFDVGINEVLGGQQRVLEVRHGRDVRRVHANERASLESTVELALSGGDLGSSIRPGSGEGQHATAGSLHGADGRRNSAEHKRGPFRVQVGVGIFDESKRAPDVAKSEGHIGGGGEKNRGHCCVLSRRAGCIALNCYKYTILSEKVSGIIVPDFRGRVGRASRVVVVPVYPQAHTGIVPH